jgi:hypothetical protein
VDKKRRDGESVLRGKEEEELSVLFVADLPAAVVICSPYHLLCICLRDVVACDNAERAERSNGRSSTNKGGKVKWSSRRGMGGFEGEEGVRIEDIQ